jgi:hypothetical protein
MRKGSGERPGYLHSKEMYEYSEGKEGHISESVGFEKELPGPVKIPNWNEKAS